MLFSNWKCYRKIHRLYYKICFPTYSGRINIPLIHQQDMSITNSGCCYIANTVPSSFFVYWCSSNIRSSRTMVIWLYSLFNKKLPKDELTDPRYVCWGGIRIREDDERAGGETWMLIHRIHNSIHIPPQPCSNSTCNNHNGSIHFRLCCVTCHNKLRLIMLCNFFIFQWIRFLDRLYILCFSIYISA